MKLHCIAVLVVACALLFVALVTAGPPSDSEYKTQSVAQEERIKELESELAITRNSLLDWQCRACELDTERLERMRKGTLDN